MTISSAAQRARFFQRFENGDEVARGGADLIHGAHDLIEIDARIENKHARRALIDFDVGTRGHDGLAIGERDSGWLTSLRSGDRHRQRAVRNRGRRHSHRGADHDSAGTGNSRSRAPALRLAESRSLRASRDEAIRWPASVGACTRTETASTARAVSGPSILLMPSVKPSRRREIRRVEIPA